MKKKYLKKRLEAVEEHRDELEFILKEVVKELNECEGKLIRYLPHTEIEYYE